jgi:hypothetical protein
MKELIAIQTKLKTPKGQWNKFGSYNYRSCEDILEAVKPLLTENSCELTLSDEVVLIGNRIYVKATATLRNAAGIEIVTTAFAREEETKKGMDGSQITGASSSYARKYALNGLFCIDDTKDSDATNIGETKNEDETFLLARQEIFGATTIDVLTDIWKNYPTLHADKKFVELMTNRKKELNGTL